MSLLSYGSTGDSVKTLQQNLNTVGNYGLADDGIYGEKTKAAVTDYQKKNGLGVDGIVGDETSGSLAKALAAKTAAASKPAATASTASPTGSAAVSASTGMQMQKVDTAPPPSAVEKASYAEDLTPQLDAWLAAAKEQQTARIDYDTEKNVKELQRAEEDAAPEFQTQRNQIAAAEAKALSNQALYSEARGDKGGIGQEQYNSVQNQAAQNMLMVNQAQTKLSTDTARQIADLRAQGDFEKADALLTLTQTYLSQLMSLKQWALEYNLSVDQFNTSLKQWEAEYTMKAMEYNNSLDQWNAEFEMSQASLTGMYRGQKTLAAKQAEQETLAGAGEALLTAGIMPSEAQLSAMGMTKSQAQSYINAVKMAAAASSSGSSSGGSGGSKTSSKSGGGGYNNGGLDTEKVKALQRALGLTGSDVDGLYGSQTKAKAGGLSADEAYRKYVGSSGTSTGSSSGLSAQAAYNNSVAKASASSYSTAYDRAKSYKSAGAAKGRTQALLMQYVDNGSITTAQMNQILNQLY